MRNKDHLCVMYTSENDLLRFYSNLPAMAKQRIKLYPKWNALSLLNQDYEILKDRMAIQGESETKGPIIEQNVMYKLHQTYSDKQVTPWGVSRVQAPTAWSRNQGDGVRVGIIDTGIDARHPDLRDNVKGGINTVDTSSPFVDRNGHGTHVAGIVAALNNQIGVVGVSPKAALYALKAFDADGTASLTDIAQAIDWAIDNNIRILNLSFGSRDTSKILHQAIKAALKKGILMIASAGNSSETLDYPARHPEVLAVGAINKNGRVPSFSNFGKTLNYVEPGVDILSTWPESPNYNTLSGTSMATPHLTGICALLLSQAPELTPSQIKRILDRSAQKLPRISSRKQGRGIVKVNRVLSLANRLSNRTSPS
ncbi:S8 family peptidase [Ammoniphilus sp. CFH 90114]|uniref:S8 family peptidase n=1 Tax=Ammoniphilus sp. CFH 90114 TaxID=2493665 RepID=UPI00100DC0ED|nr:S8 family peptidase [Ammoniphilus sp. CFH 90114]RXT08159.1 peptidase S8 [Ammoniphilus sp. CFH 90114]